MSDRFTNGSTAFGASFVGSPDEKSREFAPEPTVGTDNPTPQNTAAGQLDLRPNLDWLLGQSPEHEIDLSQEELQEKQRRRIDLLLWILHLEPRLTPYGEPA